MPLLLAWSLPAIQGYYLTMGSLALCSVVGFTLWYRFRREVDHDLAPPTPREVLDPLEQAYVSGLMHPSEIERIRESIRRQKAGLPPLVPPPAKLIITAGPNEGEDAPPNEI